MLTKKDHYENIGSLGIHLKYYFPKLTKRPHIQGKNRTVRIFLLWIWGTGSKGCNPLGRWEGKYFIGDIR